MLDPPISAARGYVLPFLPWGLAFWTRVFGCFWLRFGFSAMGISVVEELLFLGWFVEFILLRLEGHQGERFGGIVWGGCWRGRGYPPN